MVAVILTRPQGSVEQTAAVYQQAGFDVFLAPCFDIQTNSSVQTKWLHTPADVWVILSVHALQHALLIDPDLCPETHTKVIAVGPAVVNAWQQHFNHPIHSHPNMNSEGVIELIKQENPRAVKILTTGGGRDLLRSYCMQQRISYSQINTYERRPLVIENKAVNKLFQQAKPPVLTATSVGILQHFMSQLDADNAAKIKTSPLVAGSQRIQQAAQDMGFNHIHVAEDPSDVAMCEAVQSLNR